MDWQMSPEKDTFEAFGTVVNITVYGDREAAHHALGRIRVLCSEYESLFSRTVPGSDVWRINEAEGGRVEIDPRTSALLESALGYCDASEGLFDITVGALVAQWDFKRGIIADRARLEEAAQAVGWRSIVFEGENSVRISNPGGQVDLGGIAKGWIADALRAALKPYPIAGYVIDLGGNIVVGGRKPAGTPWKIGVRDPLNPRGTGIASIELESGSVVTSGVYERCFVAGGTFYHHVLDTRTGMPRETDLLSATVIADDSLTAEGFSTTLLALGADRAREFVRSKPEIRHALLITRNRDIVSL